MADDSISFFPLGLLKETSTVFKSKLRHGLLHIKSVPVGRDEELYVLGSSPAKQKSASHRSEAGGLSLSDTPTLGVEC